MRKKLIIILSVVLVLLLGLLSYKLYQIYNEDRLALAEYNLYGSSAYVMKVDDEEIENLEITIDEEVNLEEVTPEELYAEQIKIQRGINWNAFRNKNEDFIGIISIPELDMWYPIVQNSEADPDFYLSHTYSKEKNSSGAIFLDYLFHKDFSDNHVIMFGHNMKNMTMFGAFRTFIENNYTDDFFLYVYQQDQILVYKITAAYLTEPGSIDYWAQLPSDKEYVRYYTHAVKLAKYLKLDDLTKKAYANSNPLLTLSTCHASDHSNYTIVQSILIERIMISDEKDN